MANKKKETFDVTVILPVHELNETTTTLLKQAIASVGLQEVAPEAVFIVVPKGSEIVKTVKGMVPKSMLKYTVLENDGETDFCSQVNFGIEATETEWFSILEYDDEYSKIWFKNVATYVKAYPDVGIFMPMIVDVNEEGQYMGGTNEAVWANQFSDEMGLLDTDALLRYQNFNTDGVVMKKEVIDDFGGFKPSIKLTFIYEFLLRMTHSGIKTMVIPKIGYKHVNLREGSLFHTYREEMDDVESRWWMNKAKKEYFWNEDRKIIYEKAETD